MSGESETVFDLSAVSKLQAREDRVPRTILVAAGSVLALGALYSAIVPPVGVSGSPAFRLLLGTLGVAGAAVAGTAVLYPPLARVRKLRIGARGITVVGSGPWTRTVPWSGRGQTIVLEDWRDRYHHAGYGSRRSGLIWTRPGPRQFDLTSDAFEGTIEAAKRAGWSVHTLEFTVGAGTRTGVVRRVTCKS